MSDPILCETGQPLYDTFITAISAQTQLSNWCKGNAPQESKDATVAYTTAQNNYVSHLHECPQCMEFAQAEMES